MTTANFSTFARHLGVAPSYITKLKAEGRLVLNAAGLVEVEASEQLIAQTAGNRPDVAARNAQTRTGAKKAAGQGNGASAAGKTAQRATTQAATPPVTQTESEKIGTSLQTARAFKEKYSALKAKAEYETMIGDLISREDVEAAMRFIGGAVRAALEVFPDQTAPLVAPVSNLAEIHEILTQSARDALHGIGEAIKRQQDELKTKATA